MKIIHLIATKAALLLVYSTNNSLYSYQILFSDGLIYSPQEFYLHSYIALNLGRDRIKLVTGYSD